MHRFVSKRMQDGSSINRITMVGALSAWVQVGETKHGNVFVEVRNLDYDVVVGSLLVDMHLRRVGVEDAYKVFHRIRRVNLLVCITYWYCSYFGRFSCPKAYWEEL